jgi:hypothetical protein
MIVQKKIHPGTQDFPERPIIIRNPAVLTTSYVRAQDLRDWRDPIEHDHEGDIRIAHASQATIQAYVEFGSLSSVEIKTVVTPPDMPAFKYGSAALSLASERTLTETVGTPFVDSDKGRYLHLVSGTNAKPGIYRIEQVTSSQLVLLDRNPGGNITSDGVWFMFGGEFQEMAQTTSGGVTTLQPHSYQMASSAGDGCWAFTFPLPAMARLRVYAKGTGTVTGSILALAVNLMAPGGE